jgi:hypothetical protein
MMEFESSDNQENRENLDEEEPTAILLPGFETGGRVEKTGIALVHEGEYILPASGSEAHISPTTETIGTDLVVNYYFPVEIEIIGEISREQVQDITEKVFSALDRELASRQ